MKAKGTLKLPYYPESPRYLAEYPPTIHAMLHFIRRIEAEISFLTEAELDLWVKLEMRPWVEPLRDRFKRNHRVAKDIKPTFEEFMEARNRLNIAA